MIFTNLIHNCAYNPKAISPNSEAFAIAFHTYLRSDCTQRCHTDDFIKSCKLRNAARYACSCACMPTVRSEKAPILWHKTMMNDGLLDDFNNDVAEDDLFEFRKKNRILC